MPHLHRSAIAAVLALGLAACQPTDSATNTSQAEALSGQTALTNEQSPAEDETSLPSDTAINLVGTEPEFSDAIRAEYNEIDLAGRSEDPLQGEDPVALTNAMLGSTEPSEGNYREAIEAEIGNERTVVYFIQDNLPDDSVQGIRSRLEYERFDGPWQFVWAGEQYRCQEGRGHQDWSTELCS